MSEAGVTDSAQGDPRPVVPLPAQGNLGLIAFIIVLLAGGAMLFGAMSANRTATSVPRTTATLSAEGARISAPPPLALPPGYQGATAAPTPLLAEREVLMPAVPPAPREEGRAGRGFTLPPGFVPPTAPPPFVPSVPTPAVVFEDRSADGNWPDDAEPRQRRSGDRVTASRLANPSRTVPRGTVIPAVLETALDSTRPGAARGLVQRDIHGFDGSRVLIPRGSRLYGEYEADLTTGQRRAAIRWTRLLRPDGVTIELDSPASDPLGRAGVRGKVDSKFFQRFGGAILQSVLDVGVGVATREASDGVIVALPGSTQNVQVTDQQQVQPTLKVRQGTSVSVFVARDLDFSTVDP